jgi:hypothetical protein
MIARWRAIYRVWRGQAERICAPGKWRVWRDGARVLSEVMGNG